jgi:hypothetical protein
MTRGTALARPRAMPQPPCPVSSVWCHCPAILRAQTSHELLSGHEQVLFFGAWHEQAAVFFGECWHEQAAVALALSGRERPAHAIAEHGQS